VTAKFTELFEAYQPALRRLVNVYVTNDADREELLQDIAIGIWKALPSFRGESSERTWLYRISHNVAIRGSTQLRTRNQRQPALEGDYASSQPHVQDELIAAERRKSMLDAIRELPLLERQIVSLHLEGLSAGEIEDVTGLSSGAVATRLTRIRQRLAERVQSEGTRHA
jgi:RNA polymerase sigma factor (sigma-70 family)